MNPKETCLYEKVSLAIPTLKKELSLTMVTVTSETFTILFPPL